MTELLYKKIYHFIKEQIDSGQLQAGDRLPTEKALSEQFFYRSGYLFLIR
ncbi:GntR family transcriptional regulator [Streptococcus equi subsp. zooepidemicus]|nr:GntR family transcriptional regulator [Streptococcus equi]MCD3438325.1 GntR family transcriptional regulator [Streptococcus equi subsp. zooepidemicus]